MSTATVEYIATFAVGTFAYINAESRRTKRTWVVVATGLLLGLCAALFVFVLVNKITCP